MSIVKMKHLRLFAMAADRDELLRQLQHLGCVEIREPDQELGDPAWAGFARVDDTALADTKARADRLRAALDLLGHYAPAKGSMFQPRPQVSEAQLFDASVRQEALAAAQRISDLETRIAAIANEQSKLTAQRASLAPWLELDAPLDLTSTREVSVTYGAVERSADRHAVETALASEAELAELSWAGQDRVFQYVLVFCHRSAEEAAMAALKPFGFTPASLRGWTGTARANPDAIETQLRSLAEELDACKADIGQEAGHREALRLTIDRLSQDIQREEVKGRLLSSGATLFLEGWVPADQLSKVEDLLTRHAAAWETADPTPEEYPEVPIELKNNWFTKPLNMVTDMYALPAYNGVDPNPLMAPFFIFFYGFMMADMGYGLLMMLASVIILKKVRPRGPTMRHMIPLLGLCGVSTFIMGALTGGFFGDLIPQLVKLTTGREVALPALFSPLDDALAVLIGSLAIGVLQIFTGMGISMYRKIKRGNVMGALCDEGAWYAVFILFGLGAAMGWLKPALIAALVILVLTQGYGKKGFVSKFMGIAGSLYNHITGYFSDILSYSRLMALMLAGAVIAQVFNTLGGITGNVVAFFLISMVGNALNFALNLLGCYVHDMRLQCLEFFSRFYEDGGKPFRPLCFDTKYFDIVQE